MREVVGERHLGPLLDEGGRDLEAVVRVDTPEAGPADRRPRIEREAGRMCQQVPERRAGRARRLVEVDEPLLRGDEHRHRRRHLRHRGPRESPPRVPVRRGGSAGDADGDVVARPPVDLAQRIHERRD